MTYNWIVFNLLPRGMTGAQGPEGPEGPTGSGSDNPVGDFTEPLEDILLNYMTSKWSIQNPDISQDPPHDFDHKVRFGDFVYGYMSTYFIRIKEQDTTFDNDLIVNGIYQIVTQIFIDLTARRLKVGEHFQELNNMRLEVIRILGNYRPDDISGIEAIDIDSPGERDIEPRTLDGGRSVWYLRINANLHYSKGYIETP